MVDIIEIIDQLKVFIREEKDTVLGLIFFWVAEILIISYLINEFFVQIKEYSLYIIGLTVVLTFVMWIYNRRIWLPRNLISIAVANFNIISLDIKEGLDGAQRVVLEQEIRKYMSESLHGHKNRLNFSKYISIIDVPARIKITQRNARHKIKKIGANILIWGNVKYISSSVVRVEPRVEFLVEPQDIFYQKLRKRLMQEKAYTIDLTKELVSTKDSKLASFIHYLTYIGLLFEGIKMIRKREFEEANTIYVSALKQLSTIQNPTRELVDLYVILSFYQAKGLHQWGRWLAKHGKEKMALEKFDAASNELFTIAKKRKRGEYNEIDFLEHSYLYGVHLLLKQGKLDLAKKKLAVVKRRFTNDPEMIKEKIDYLNAVNIQKAQKFVKEVEKKIIRSPLVLKRVGDFYYDEGKFSKAQKFYEAKIKASKEDFYDAGFFDVQTMIHLLNSHIHTLELLKAQRDAIIGGVEEVVNVMKKKL